VERSASASGGRVDEITREPCEPLGEALRRVLDHPAARALAAQLWGVDAREQNADSPAVSVGIPRRIARSRLARWLRADDAACAWVRVPQDGATRFALLVPRGDAARWVDRLLGGSGEIGRAADMREAEYGVLAYALARAAAELGADFTLSELGAARPEPLACWCDGGVIWPLSLLTPLGHVDVRVLLGPGALARAEQGCELSLALREELRTDALDLLEPGDVLLSDQLSLTLTRDGLVGPATLRVRGSDEPPQVLLEGDRLRLNGSATRAPTPSARVEARGSLREHNDVELVFGVTCVSLSALAELAGGGPLTLPRPTGDPTLLYHRGRPKAEGELVTLRGEIGVRVRRLLEPAAGPHSIR
jgi:hypothetical protein